MVNDPVNSLLGYPYNKEFENGQTFRFFGHEFANIRSIHEEGDGLWKRYTWLTRDKKVHTYEFQKEGNHTDDLDALLVALRMS